MGGGKGRGEGEWAEGEIEGDNGREREQATEGLSECEIEGMTEGGREEGREGDVLHTLYVSLLSLLSPHYFHFNSFLSPSYLPLFLPHSSLLYCYIVNRPLNTSHLL